jgi:hypothetical protein
MNTEFEILSPVALLQDDIENHLVKGQVGTIVEILGSDFFEVEFCDKEGQTIAQIPVQKSKLLLLYYRLIAA